MSESQNHLKNLNNIFKNYLENIEYPSKEEKNELWNIAGIIKNKSNQKFKFDTRPIRKEGFKIGSFNTKADKMVFYLNKKWIIIDIEELHSFIKKHKVKDIDLEELIKKLDWNIVL
jgi:hypothetical protein|tara:strand:- start:592 stop:939 length:348 start_codon:yes stop_codon:yes gene_type:complete